MRIQDLNLILKTELNYLSSTTAPASSRDFLSPSASSLETPSLMFDGAESTKSFASLRPKPVNSFTALTTASLEAPASFNTTVNSVCTSSAAASPPPAATTTAAAAGSIPYSFFLSF